MRYAVFGISMCVLAASVGQVFASSDDEEWQRAVASAGKAWMSSDEAGSGDWTRHPGELGRFAKKDRPFRCMSYGFWVHALGRLTLDEVVESTVAECREKGAAVRAEDVREFRKALGEGVDAFKRRYGERYLEGTLADAGHAKILLEAMSR